VVFNPLVFHSGLEKIPEERGMFRYVFRRWCETGISDVTVATHDGFGTKKALHGDASPYHSLYCED
jgi:hypothetical protein